MTAADPSSPGRRRIAVVGAAGLAVFAALAVQIVLHSPWLAQLDPGVSEWWAAHRMPVLSLLMRGVSAWHSTIGIDVMLAMAVALLARRQRWRDALWLAVAVQGSMLLNVGLKHAFARPRPVLPAPLVHLDTYSFPSGHALAATVLWTGLVLLAPRRFHGVAAVGAALLVALVAFSRVYLGAHYLSDVVAGIAEGLACAAAWRLLRAPAQPWDGAE